MSRCEQYREEMTRTVLSPEAAEHLKQCETCRSQHEEWLTFRKVLTEQKSPEIPASLDFAIRSAARKNSRKRNLYQHFRLWVPAAASFAVIAGLSCYWGFEDPSVDAGGIRAVQKVASDWGASSLEAGVADLSLELDQSASMLSFNDRDLENSRFEMEMSYLLQ